MIPVIGVWAGYFPLQFNWWFALAFTIYTPCCYMLLYYCHSPSQLRSIYFSIVAAHMFWFGYAKATFNTIISAAFRFVVPAGPVPFLCKVILCVSQQLRGMT